LRLVGGPGRRYDQPIDSWGRESNPGEVEVPMSSMRKFSDTGARLGALVLLAVMIAGCGEVAQSFATRPPAPIASSVRVVVPDSSAAAASGGPRATAAAATVDKITVTYTYKDALITPIAHLYGTWLEAFVIATIVNHNSASVKVVVESEISGFTDTASDTVTVAAGATQEVRQNPRLTTSAIDSLTSQKQADLHVVVSYLDNGQPRTILDQTNQTLVTSRRDFPWTIKGMTEQQDYNLIAAMVTPTDPGVELLIRAAANYDPNGIMTSGYDSQNDSSGSVEQRLTDVWQAEDANYHLTYIGTTDSFASSSSQRIRLPAETLDQSSGNCIELTLLYASVVEAMGMQPSIIFIPGHAYVAVRVDGTGDSYYFVETTMIGHATFSQAVSKGLSEWNDAAASVNAGDAQYGWVDVAAQRAKGVLPIPWH
jgi:hypothetical protein